MNCNTGSAKENHTTVIYFFVISNTCHTGARAREASRCAFTISTLVQITVIQRRALPVPLLRKRSPRPAPANGFVMGKKELSDLPV
jgi:hypothetical protein